MTTPAKGSTPGLLHFPSKLTSFLHHRGRRSQPEDDVRSRETPKNNEFDMIPTQPGAEGQQNDEKTIAPPANEVPHNVVQEDQDQDQDEEQDIEYPEGGFKAYLVVFGSFCSMTAGFGILNTVGPFQAYVSANQLKQYDESTVSWIFSIYLFITFFCGLQIGPIFDMYGPQALIAVGSVCTVAMLLILGVCTQYWHFILNFSLLGGLGASLLFTPAIGAIAHWFNKKRGQATGLAATGGSFGGIIFPLALQSLFPKIGWAWTTRVLALIVLLLCVFAILLTRSRLPPKRGGSVLPSFGIFLDGTGAMAYTTAGIFFIEWALFVPLSYLTQYALSVGVSTSFSYQLMAILNAGSCIGRYVPGYVADRWGRYNTMLATVLGCILCVFALWLPSDYVTHTTTATPLLITFALLFGFTSGSNISLTPICVGQLCETHEYGRYYATVYTIVSFGSLTGLPIAGAIVKAAGGRYWGLVLFAGVSYAVAFVAFGAARVGRCGWDWRAIW